MLLYHCIKHNTIWTQMIIEDPDNYKLVGFERSKVRGKKYDAILRNKTAILPEKGCTRT